MHFGLTPGRLLVTLVNSYTLKPFVKKEADNFSKERKTLLRNVSLSCLMAFFPLPVLLWLIGVAVGIRVGPVGLVTL